ncbi:hypothetical protein BKA82DRAFT_402114 [Pisolithus tinctorius]|uniref:Uncharacterized protein n=1 Tax=Pisolithus tinctorius Marx 270 TaxID=870435 RepID=A0A0C3NF17_PISTI|nr:hypothetical protein BKA82DRAFT_402114 [Pisolithus tinctorius]KIN94320.1 hypothetical protein M404DRAFT_402114 [Pisolithus tinctorius Marx 270]
MRDRSIGVAGQVTPANLMKFILLTVRGHALIKELSTCSVGSGGLQISLPIAPYPSLNSSPSLFRATLACVASLAGPLMTIDLVSDSTRYYRCLGATGEVTTFPWVKQVFLSYYQDESRSRRTLILDDGTVSFYGFKRCGAFPCSIVGNSVKLSRTNDLIVVIYANDEADIRFAVGFGYYLGNPWTHVIYDESRLTPWEDYAKKAYGSLSTRQADLARSISGHDATAHTDFNTASFIKHARLPRSVWAARVMWGVWYRGNCTVAIDIVLCTGCCRGPLAWKPSTTDWNGIETPGPMQELTRPPPSMGCAWMGFKCSLFISLAFGLNSVTTAIAIRLSGAMATSSKTLRQIWVGRVIQ